MQFSKVFIVRSKQTDGHRNESYLSVLLFTDCSCKCVAECCFCWEELYLSTYSDYIKLFKKLQSFISL